ncbi:MAG: hypothetical protein ACE5PV_04405, partial [Candidatus Poribacteria bacterium]
RIDTATTEGNLDMSKIADYFNEIQITALAQPSVVSVEKIRETEDQKENIGVYRYRIYMKNGVHLEMTARVKIEVRITKEQAAQGVRVFYSQPQSGHAPQTYSTKRRIKT